MHHLTPLPLICCSPKQVQEAKHLDQHPNEGPPDEDEEHAREEAYRPSDLLLPRKEVKGLLRTNEEGDARCEENVAQGQEGGIEEEDDAKDEKEGA